MPKHRRCVLCNSMMRMEKGGLCTFCKAIKEYEKKWKKINGSPKYVSKKLKVVYERSL